MFRIIQRLFLLSLVVMLASACGTSKPTAKTASQPARPTAPTTPQIIVGWGALPTEMPQPTVPPAALPVVMPASPIAPLPGATIPLAAPNAPAGVAARTTLIPAIVEPAVDPSTLPLGPGCDNPQAQITYPRDGQIFNWGATIPVTGTANVADFLFYKMQYIPQASYDDPVKHDAWGELYANEKDPRKLSGPPKPVVDGLLMTWQTKTLARGTYYLRLLATNRTGNYGDSPCQVKIIVR